MKIIIESAEEEAYLWTVLTGTRGMKTSPFNPGKEYAPYCPMDFHIEKDGADCNGYCQDCWKEAIQRMRVIKNE